MRARSAEARVLIASITTTIVFLILLVAMVEFRPAPLFSFFIYFVWLPLSTLLWTAATGTLAFEKKWLAALLACAYPMLVASKFIFDVSPYPPIQRMEFELNRSSYDALVARIPTSFSPRTVRVSFRETTGFCCGGQIFEEIWFDESNQLRDRDPPDQHHIFWAPDPTMSWMPHPSRSSCWDYYVRALGSSYYFVESGC
jgi:hypothetical protein